LLDPPSAESPAARWLRGGAGQPVRAVAAA
jgi:hypothetical protein